MMKALLFSTILISLLSPLFAEKPDSSFQSVSEYLKIHKTLPDFYITKKEAKSKGWIPSRGNLHKVLPGMSIGGDRFGNREKKLPVHQCGKSTKWIEADIDYQGGRRGGRRIVYCLDRTKKEIHIFKTEDHYKTFQEVR
ncbi:MAG: ribonuclease [Leptospiraceae bacterium]|nr:hypothetical protein [Leptospiraceae bacterium]MCP5513578.1 ribonuclease [Leptospiraceae bacterium]